MDHLNRQQAPFPAAVWNLIDHAAIEAAKPLLTACTHGVYKSVVDRPVIVDKHAGAIVVGQDMHMGYAGTDGIHYQLFICESVVLRLDEPSAVCVIAE